MSRAGAKASRERKRLEAEARELEAVFAKAERDAFADAAVVACEGCGLEQVQPGPLGCVLCGCEMAQFVRSVVCDV